MNKEQQRLYLAVALSAVVLLVWQWKFAPKPRLAPAIDGGAGQIAQEVVDGGAPAAGAVTTAAAPSPAAASTDGGVIERPKEELVEFDGKDLHLVFSSYGGALKSAVLKDPQARRKVDGKDVQVDLVNVTGHQPLPFSTTLGGGLPTLPEDQPYAVEKSADGVTFTAQVGGLTVAKRYTVPPAGYDVALAVELKNGGAGSLAGTWSLGIDGYVPPAPEKGTLEKMMSRGPVDARLPVARVDGDTKRQQKDDDGKPKVVTGQLAFAGLDEHYFLAAAYPVSDKAATVSLSTPASGLRRADLSFPVTVAPGATTARTVGLYLGPKLKESLEDAGKSLPALASAKPELEQAVEYGLLAVIAVILLVVMRFFHGVVPNWGVDILLLTLAVKIATLPLTMKQMASAEKMRGLQPQIDEIRTKYKDDKERQNAEMMKLYTKGGANPMSGCLPLIIQMPVFFGLYRCLEYAYDIYRQPFIAGWVNDLSAQDHTYVLPALLIVSMFVSQRMMPQMGDAAQQKMMMYVMPVMFGFFMIGLPAGLSLYYAFNNVLNIAQQLWLRKRYPNARPPAGKK